ncbi:hypothetical protein AURDEDRAFT_161045 [Auricularia subglabra TFB-10046 SS5]|nr:hypothetical protein AURDEDRAFT_161045 [Auricularia subglabra TFB-10046 SS5]
MFSVSLGRRSDQLFEEFDGLFAPSPRAMSDMRDIAGKVSQCVALASQATMSMRLSSFASLVSRAIRRVRSRACYWCPPSICTPSSRTQHHIARHWGKTRAPWPSGIPSPQPRRRRDSRDAPPATNHPLYLPTSAVRFSQSLARRSDGLPEEFDRLFASSPRAMSDMRNIAGKVSHIVLAPSVMGDLGRSLGVQLTSVQLTSVRRPVGHGIISPAFGVQCGHSAAPNLTARNPDADPTFETRHLPRTSLMISNVRLRRLPRPYSWCRGMCLENFDERSVPSLHTMSPPRPMTGQLYLSARTLDLPLPAQWHRIFS